MSAKPHLFTHLVTIFPRLDQNSCKNTRNTTINLAEPLILLHSFKVGLEKHGFRPNSAAKKRNTHSNKDKAKNPNQYSFVLIGENLAR